MPVAVCHHCGVSFAVRADRPPAEVVCPRCGKPWRSRGTFLAPLLVTGLVLLGLAALAPLGMLDDPPAALTVAGALALPGLGCLAGAVLFRR